MQDLEVTIRKVDLPDGPRGTLARLRATAPGPHALLDSALAAPTAEWSYLAGSAVAQLYTDESTTRLLRHGRETARWTDPFDALATVATPPRASPCFIGERPGGLAFTGGWIGLLGYDVDAPPGPTRHDPPLPRQWWMAVDQVLAFHRPSRQWWCATSRGPADAWPWSDADRAAVWADTLARAAGPLPPRRAWSAGARERLTSRAEFEAGVARIRDRIAAGDLLQANLTRREDVAFTGDPLALYADFVAAHPAPFAAFVEGPGFAVASCSPERFLRRRGDMLQARPIKGTAPRGHDPADDRARRDSLAASVKDRAENLMIVDLMRNDLGRIAVTGSVRVDDLFALEPYASVWQMVSTVSARQRPDVDLAQLLRAVWPPGSMTGAPKRAAMKLIEALEPVRRGFYAGAIGYLDAASGDLDLSVVIRTAVVAAGRVMLQLGAGIVADSTPEAEWDETVAKGRRLAEVLDQNSGCRASERR